MKRSDIKKLIIKNKNAIIIVTVLAVLSGGIIFVKAKSSKNQQLGNIVVSENTVKLEKGDINQSIVVTGSIKSGEVSNVSSSINAKVKSVSVKVGDVVKAGDIICVLDDSDIVKEIESKTKEIEEQRKTLKENCSKLVSQLNSLKSVQSENLEAQNKIVEGAKDKLNEANDILNSYEPTFNKIKNTYNVMMSGIKDKYDNYNNAASYKDQCYEAWVKSGGRTDSQEYKNYMDASENLNKKQDELNEAKELYDYEDINNSYTEASMAYNEKLAARDTAKAQYDEAVANSKSSASSNKSEIDTLQTSINDANSQIQKLNDNEELKELKEKLDKTVLKAETSGKITELKVNVGSMTDGAIATIQSTDTLILEASIPEYDIRKVTTGMKAKISSDTLTEKVDGELVRISPVAAEGDKKGFSAEISIANGSGLFIGTNAKAEIIISGKQDVILAPIDAIKDIDSNPTVLLKEANGEFKEVPVTIGEKNDYYVEISGTDIKVGKEISADAGYSNSDSGLKSSDEATSEDGGSVNEGF